MSAEWVLTWEILRLLCAVCPWSGQVRCVLSSTGSGPGYDTVFSVVLMRTLQRSDAGCKCPPPHPAPYLSISGPYLDVCEVTWQDSLWWFNTCKHGQRWDLFLFFFPFWVLSSLCLCSGSFFLSCSVFFLHQFTNVIHQVCVFYMVFILYYTVCLRLD